MRIDGTNFNWHELIDKTSGDLSQPVKETITKNSDTKIAVLFEALISKRNRIIHSFQITENNEQVLRTKTRNNEQFNITKSYLLDFIKYNEELSTMLHKLKGH